MKRNELPEAPERPGYDFDSWNTAEDGSGKNYKDKDTVSKLVEEDGGNVTIYAQWKKKRNCVLKCHQMFIRNLSLIRLQLHLQKAGSVIIRIKV